MIYRSRYENLHQKVRDCVKNNGAGFHIQYEIKKHKEFYEPFEGEINVTIG